MTPDKDLEPEFPGQKIIHWDDLPPEIQDMLTRSLESPNVHRQRPRRRFTEAEVAEARRSLYDPETTSVGPVTSPLFGGSLGIQVDPVVIGYLHKIQQSQHNRDQEAEAELKRSLMEYVSDYQEKPMFRRLPDWARL